MYSKITVVYTLPAVLGSHVPHVGRVPPSPCWTAVPPWGVQLMEEQAMVPPAYRQSPTDFGHDKGLQN